MPSLLHIYRSHIGKKAVMAVTGAILVGFVVIHLAGNLLIFWGPEYLNAYGAALHSLPTLRWGLRLGLLAAGGLHVVTAAQLALASQSARRVGYHYQRHVSSSLAARTMRWSGLLLLGYVIYHLLHLTTGHAHPDFTAMDIHHNVITGLRSPVVSLIYIGAMLALGAHLYQGIYSMFPSVGIGSPAARPEIKKLAVLVSLLVTLGNVSIPLAVMTGLLK